MELLGELGEGGVVVSEEVVGEGVGEGGGEGGGDGEAHGFECGEGGVVDYGVFDDVVVGEFG